MQPTCTDRQRCATLQQGVHQVTDRRRAQHDAKVDQVIERLRTHRAATLDEIVERLACSKRTVQRILRDLGEEEPPRVARAGRRGAERFFLVETAR